MLCEFELFEECLLPLTGGYESVLDGRSIELWPLELSSIGTRVISVISPFFAIVNG